MMSFQFIDIQLHYLFSSVGTTQPNTINKQPLISFATLTLQMKVAHAN